MSTYTPGNPATPTRRIWSPAPEAAAAGGYTTIFGMPNLDPPTMTADDLDEVLRLYAEKSIVDYNHNPAAKLVDEIPAMATRGIAAYKIYMGWTPAGPTPIRPPSGSTTMGTSTG